MELLKKVLIISIFTFITNNAVLSDTPFFLDFKYILNESNAGKKAQTFLKNKLEKGLKDLKSKEKQIKNDEQILIQPKKIISSDEYRKKVTELRQKISQLHST